MEDKKIDLWEIFKTVNTDDGGNDRTTWCCELCPKGQQTYSHFDPYPSYDNHFKEHHQKEFELFYRGILVCLFGACSECQPVPVEYKPLWTDFSRGIWKTRERICGNCGKIFQKDP